MPKFRIFTNDVGPRAFSAFKDVTARDAEAAIMTLNPFPRSGRPVVVLALPHSRKDLWPDGKTGKVPSEAMEYSAIQNERL